MAVESEHTPISSSIPSSSTPVNTQLSNNKVHTVFKPVLNRSKEKIERSSYLKKLESPSKGRLTRAKSLAYGLRKPKGLVPSKGNAIMDFPLLNIYLSTVFTL